MRVFCSTAVAGVRREGGRYRLDLANGGAHEAEALILATNAAQARALLRAVPGSRGAPRGAGRL